MSEPDRIFATVDVVKVLERTERWIVTGCGPSPLDDIRAALVASRRMALLREALEFYADPFAWKELHDPQDIIRIPDFYSELSFGGAAAEALAAFQTGCAAPKGEK